MATRYAERADLATFGLPSAVLTTVSTSDQDAALDAASAMADDYLSSAYDLPLTSWGIGLRRRVCVIAAYDLLRVRGFNPEGSDALVVDAYHEALAWLEKVAKGQLLAAESSDQTPTVTENAPTVDSDDVRGW